MTVFSRLSGLVLLLATLCPAGQAAYGQAAPIQYWLPGWPIGFGGNLPSDDQGASAYGNFDTRNGVSSARYNFSNGWFVGSERGTGLNMSGFSSGGASGLGALQYDGMKVGYNFQNSPVSVFAGFNTLKYNSGIGDPFTALDSRSSTMSGYSAQAGIEYKPTSNLSLSLGVGFAQQQSNGDVLPGVAPFAVRR